MMFRPGEPRFGSRAKPRAFTLVEMIVAATVLLAVLGVLYGFSSVAGRSTVQSVGSSDAIRSTLIASECIRQDFSRMIVRDLTQDLFITEDGRQVACRVPTIASDFWETVNEPVRYSLDPLAGTATGNRLMREGNDGRKPVPGCVLRDLLVRYITPEWGAASSGYLEFTIVGMGSSDSSTYTGVLLIPITPVTPPPSYRAATGAS